MKIVCLATPVEAPERYAAAQRHFDEVGLTVRWAHGLHKDTSGLITTHNYQVDRPEGSPDFGKPFSIGPHPVNIWIGHYMIWNALVLSDDPEWFVVECDAKFPADWRWSFDQALALLDDFSAADPEGVPPYDLVYMGSCCTTGRRKVAVGAITRDDQELFALYKMFGTAPQCNHAYVVTRDAAEIMLTTLRKVWAPIDIQQASECWGDPLPRCVEPVAPPSRALNVYTVLPRIVDQWNMELPQ
jgi:hypothetical protein